LVFCELGNFIPAIKVVGLPLIAVYVFFMLGMGEFHNLAVAQSPYMVTLIKTILSIIRPSPIKYLLRPFYHAPRRSEDTPEYDHPVVYGGGKP
jgi:hypothetical protein